VGKGIKSPKETQREIFQTHMGNKGIGIKRQLLIDIV
jgi:hypothetical protein